MIVHFLYFKCRSNYECLLLLYYYPFSEKLRIITPIKDTQMKEGQEIVLNCEVNSEKAKAKWLKETETMFESSKFVMVQRDTIFSLRIKAADKSDEATYTIILTNQRGEQAKCSGKVSVIGKLFLCKITLPIGLSNMNA